MPQIMVVKNQPDLSILRSQSLPRLSSSEFHFIRAFERVEVSSELVFEYLSLFLGCSFVMSLIFERSL